MKSILKAIGAFIYKATARRKRSRRGSVQPVHDQRRCSLEFNGSKSRKSKCAEYIVFTGGGSAGHVVPNMALIDVFLKQKKTVSYIGSEEGIEKTLIAKINIPYYPIACGKLRRYFSLKNFTDPFKIFLGIFQAWQYLGKIKPNVVFSKGGFVAFPVVFAAWLRRIPVIAHESDLTPGLANRLSFPFVKKIALTFGDEKSPLPPFAKGGFIVTGTPIRASLFHGNAEKGRQIGGFQQDQQRKNKPCLMVIGGGSGATIINETVRKALPVLLQTMNVIHCCGKGKVDLALENQAGYKQFEYVNEEMADLYACSDLIVSRAGANTVYEILALKKVAIFIPLSLKASRGDQIANACFIESQGLCRVLDESLLNPDSLVLLVNETFKEHSAILEKITSYGIQSGTDAIIQLINEVSCGK